MSGCKREILKSSSDFSALSTNWFNHFLVFRQNCNMTRTWPKYSTSWLCWRRRCFRNRNDWGEKTLIIWVNNYFCWIIIGLRLILQSKESKILDQKKIIKKMAGMMEVQRIKSESDKKFVIKPIPKIVVEDTSKLR